MNEKVIYITKDLSKGELDLFLDAISCTKKDVILSAYPIYYIRNLEGCNDWTFFRVFDIPEVIADDMAEEYIRYHGYRILPAKPIKANRKFIGEL